VWDPSSKRSFSVDLPSGTVNVKTLEKQRDELEKRAEVWIKARGVTRKELKRGAKPVHQLKRKVKEESPSGKKMGERGRLIPRAQKIRS